MEIVNLEVVLEPDLQDINLKVVYNRCHYYERRKNRYTQHQSERWNMDNVNRDIMLCV